LRINIIGEIKREISNDDFLNRFRFVFVHFPLPERKSAMM
jgi:hypothetical protein